jgi:hypothetical protein
MSIFKLTVTFTAALLIGSCEAAFGQTARPITVDTSDGGSVLTKVGGDLDINKDSALRRFWYTMNDSTCPIQLVKAGVKTEQRLGTLKMKYKPVVESFVAKEPITAMEMRFALSDVFNEHIATLEITRLEDVTAPGTFMFKRGLGDNNPTSAELLLPNVSSVGSGDQYLRLLEERRKKIADEDARNPSRFDASPNDVERLLTVVSFVSQLRTKSGTVWRYDPEAMVSEVARLLHSKVDETTFSDKR